MAYRWHAQEAADRLGVRGWVRNELDGSVSCRVEGPPDAVNDFVSWCRHGPPSAQVRHVAVSPALPQRIQNFRIRF
ncbi:MAG: acylphosphatase [Nocardioides sp.]